MMRSLWSGVSGLNAHQIAMDVEANNIANVNTVGFKYSRTNFQNLLSQTVKSATAPQGTLGGKNSLQVGLGTSVSSVETIFKQGSIQNTDKNTDMAINGDGFFVVSGDEGKTYKYTRAGDFTFDANGNFVDPNGYKVMGWLADPETNTIDTAKGVQPITIPPGLTTPANPTSKIQIKANLNSGSHISEMAGTRATVDPTMDISGLYDALGNQITLVPEESNITFKVVNLKNDTITLNLTYGNNEKVNDHKFTSIEDIIDELNYAITHDTNGNYLSQTTNFKSTDYQVYLNGDGQIVDPRGLGTGEKVTFVSASTNGQEDKLLTDIFKTLNTETNTSNPVKAIQNSFIGADDVGELFNSEGDAFNLQDGEGIQVNIDGLYETRKFVYKPSSKNEASCGVNNQDYLAEATTTDSLEGMHWLYMDDGETRAGFSVRKDSTGDIKGEVAKFTVKDSNGTNHDYSFIYGKDFHTISDLVCALNTKLAQDSIKSLSVDFVDGQIVEVQTDTNGASITDAGAYDDTTFSSQSTDALKHMDSILSGLDSNGTSTLLMKKRDTYYFSNIEDLVNLWQYALDDSNDPLNNEEAITGKKGIAYINDDGKISINNTSGNSFNINIAGYPEGKDNESFTQAFSPLNGTLASGGVAASQTLNAAIHVTSMDIFDSLGSKHTITFHFRKSHTSTGPSDPTIWKFYAEVPEPAKLENPAYGEVKFNSDGSINSYNPPSLIFDPNNGAEPGQAIQLNFGDINQFNGLTSFEAPSATSGQTQDGYPGGDLEQLVVDQTGTVIGVFTNGRSYSLAQVALAKFVNNEGLMNEGGTLFSASPNSGDPIIGTAGTGGRGSIQPSSLEMSNVDLSRALTELIVIQRGFQANSKTITTSDQMLNTLLQLKQ